MVFLHIVVKQQAAELPPTLVLDLWTLCLSLLGDTKADKIAVIPSVLPKQSGGVQRLKWFSWDKH